MRKKKDQRNAGNILQIYIHRQQRLRWISYVDEYGPNFHYIEGPRNVIADTFSRLSRKDVPSTLVGKKAAHSVSDRGCTHKKLS